MEYLKWANPTIDLNQIIRTASKEHPYSEIIKVSHKIQKKLQNSIAAQGVLDYVPVKINENNQILINSHIPLSCNINFFRGASHAAIALVTIGNSLEQLSSRMFLEGNYLEGLIADSFGTAVLDKLLGLLREKISQDADRLGQKLGYTLSPGCQSIPTEEQALVFSLLDFEKAEITLTDSYEMIPAKSSSVIIPLGKDLVLTSKENYSCEICNLRNLCTHKT